MYFFYFYDLVLVSFLSTHMHICTYAPLSTHISHIFPFLYLQGIWLAGPRATRGDSDVATSISISPIQCCCVPPAPLLRGQQDQIWGMLLYWLANTEIRFGKRKNFLSRRPGGSATVLKATYSLHSNALLLVGRQTHVHTLSMFIYILKLWWYSD